MTNARSALLACVLALPALGQEGAKDVITWLDGSKTENARVQSFTLREIKFAHKGNSETKPGESVANIELAKAKEDTFKRGYGAPPKEAPGQFVEVARKLAKSEPLVAQVGFIEAARVALNLGGAENAQMAFDILKELAEQIPDTGFMGEVWRSRLDYYLAGGAEDAKNATTAADNYSKIATTSGWPDFYVNDAAYYVVMAKSSSGKLAPAALQTELKALLTKVEGQTPYVANRVNVQLAHSLLQQKKSDDAKKILDGLLAKEGLDRATYASALIGLGHVLMDSGDPTKRDPYRQALLAFLRVFVEAPDAGHEIVAEALYFGAEAAEKWSEKDSALMAGKLRSLIKKDYPDTRWGQALAGK